MVQTNSGIPVVVTNGVSIDGIPSGETIATSGNQTANPLLIGSSTADAVMLSDSAATPTTERCRVGASSSVGLAVAIAITTSNTSTLSYIVPAGHSVRINSSTTGTGSVSIISQFEEALG